jgi:hypothetical protein
MPRQMKQQAEQIIPKLREVEVEGGRGETVANFSFDFCWSRCRVRRWHYEIRPKSIKKIDCVPGTGRVPACESVARNSAARTIRVRRSGTIASRQNLIV